VNISPEEVAIV